MPLDDAIGLPLPNIGLDVIINSGPGSKFGNMVPKFSDAANVDLCIKSTMSRPSRAVDLLEQSTYCGDRLADTVSMLGWSTFWDDRPTGMVDSLSSRPSGTQSVSLPAVGFYTFQEPLAFCCAPDSFVDASSSAAATLTLTAAGSSAVCCSEFSQTLATRTAKASSTGSAETGALLILENAAAAVSSSGVLNSLNVVSSSPSPEKHEDAEDEKPEKM
uniref:Uncharacterized protein n=1 Tax=Romanomermis culicivorax TaxID=13658 RepID=A0A915I286_ROMCU